MTIIIYYIYEIVPSNIPFDSFLLLFLLESLIYSIDTIFAIFHMRQFSIIFYNVKHFCKQQTFLSMVSLYTLYIMMQRKIENNIIERLAIESISCQTICLPHQIVTKKYKIFYRLFNIRVLLSYTWEPTKWWNMWWMITTQDSTQNVW